MNLLILTDKDFVAQDKAVVRGEQAKHILKIKKAEIGDSIALGKLNGGIGSGELVSIDGGELTLKVSKLEGAGPKSSFTSLLVALPRPQILKSVLFTSAMLGVEELIFVGAARTEKSYFSSKMLQEENVERYLRLGLEQGVSTMLPRVSIVEKFRELPEKLDAAFEGDCFKIVFDPRADVVLPAILDRGSFNSESKLLLAIGPEGGWQDHEIKALREGGFSSCHLGQRIYRVDTAVTALLGMVDYSRQQKKVFK